MQVADTHTVLGTRTKPQFPEGMKTAMFGMGCFWGVEKRFWNIPDIYSTQVGYAGGHTKDPTYELVCAHGTGHAEVVRVVYNPTKTSYRDLLKVFWENHDPTQGNRQGNEVGTQYRSVIYCNDQEEVHLAQETRDIFQKNLNDADHKRQITTEIKILTEFWYAEDYHQQYLHKNPEGYCSLKGTGVKLESGQKQEA